MLNQVDFLNPKTKVGEYVLEGTNEHEWARNSHTREILNGLFGLEAKKMLNREFASLSGDKKR
jgi:ABC-type glutathione transport system ATPase component